MKSSVIRQNGESQNRCFKKTKHTKFYEKQTFLASCYAYGRGGGLAEILVFLRKYDMEYNDKLLLQLILLLLVFE